MTEVEVNIPLLRKSVEWVEEQAKLPEIVREWNQGHWVAFPEERAEHWIWDAEIDGLALMNEDILCYYEEQLAVQCGTAYCVAGKIAADADPRYVDELTVDGRTVAQKAADLLGIDMVQACDFGGLFNGSNSAADVRRIAEDLAGERL